MTFPFKRVVMGLLVCAALALPSGAKAEAPGRERLERALEALIPAGLALSNFDFRAFEMEGGTGRVSVEGTLETTEAWVRREAPQFAQFQARMLSDGMTEDEYRWYAWVAGFNAPGVGHVNIRNRVDLSFYEPVLIEGASIPFQANLRWMETVSGFDMSGQIQHEACCERSSNLGPNAVVIGSPMFERAVSMMWAWQAHERSALPAAAQQVFGALADGGLLMEGELPVALLAPMDLSAAGWEFGTRLSESGQYVDMYKGATVTQAQSLGGDVIAILGTVIEPGASAPIGLEFQMDYRAPIGHTSCIGIWNVDRQGSAQTFVCPDPNGDFRRPYGQYGGIHDYRRDVQYWIRPGVPDPDLIASALAASANRPAEATAPAAQIGANGLFNIRSLDGTWRQEGGDLTIEMRVGMGNVLSGGSGNQSDGTRILELEARSNSGLGGAQMTGDGRWVNVTGSYRDGRLDVRGMSANGTWIRVD